MSRAADVSGPGAERTKLARWRADPVRFIEQVLVNPETNTPFELFPAQRQFFAHAWRTDSAGRLLYPEQVFAAPKKTGKTATAAMHLITTTMLFGGRFGESYALANDQEQATGRVFQACRRMVEASPLLTREAVLTQHRITFPGTGATIQAISSDYASAAGANPVISSFDELWGYQSERGRRLWDEMVPVPTRKVSCRLVTTYGGFSGESVLLEELYRRGLAQPEVEPSLHAGDGLLMAWHHEPCAPWQTEAWLADMRRSLRPNQFLRMIENRFTAGEESFITPEAWDRCVRPEIGAVPSNPELPIWVGVDASVKHDYSAIVAVAYRDEMVRVAFHRIFRPSPDDPIDFEASIEATLLDLSRRFTVRQVLFDPYQMVATAQRLTRAGVCIQEFPQSVPNLTIIAQQLYELIMGQSIVCYPSEAIRAAITRCVAIETSRGWRIGKDRQSHKIDVVIALAMACHAAVQGHAEPGYDHLYRGFDPDYVDPAAQPTAQPTAAPAADQRLREFYRSLDLGFRHGTIGGFSENHDPIFHLWGPPTKELNQ